MFPLAYACKVQVQRTTKLPPFRLAITRLPLGPTALALLVLPDVSEIDAPIANRQRLIHRAALLNKMADSNSKKVQAGYKKDYVKSVRFEQRFAAVDDVFVERPPFMASAADHAAYGGYLKLLSRRKGPFRVNRVASEYAKINQDRIQNTVTISMLTGATKEARPDMHATLDTTSNANTDPAEEVLADRRRTRRTRGKLLDTKADLQEHTTMFSGSITDQKTTRSNAARTFPTFSKRPTGEDCKMVNRKQNIQGERGD